VSGWRSVKLDEIEPLPIDDGQLLWRPVRHVLDLGAFGINAFVAENVGDVVVEEHTEELHGHEEVYVVLTGRATFTLGEETLDAPAGTVVFVADPTLRRHARAEEARTSVFAVGGPRDGVYDPTPDAAELHRARRDFDAYAAELAAAVEQRPDHPGLLYVLARAEALAGRDDGAVEHLRRAIELRPTLADRARDDDDLASLRERPDWP